MGVVYYQYKSEKEICSMPVPHAFISVSELKQLILTSGKHGRGRTRGRATEDIVISNAHTGEGSFITPNSLTVLDYFSSAYTAEHTIL
jgi:E3 ubiquitin-protein ligase RBBP6